MRLSFAVYAASRYFLTDVDTARLVFSCFNSIMSYCILLWGNAADMNTVFVLHERAVREIYSNINFLR